MTMVRVRLNVEVRGHEVELDLTSPSQDERTLSGERIPVGESESEALARLLATATDAATRFYEGVDHAEG